VGKPKHPRAPLPSLKLWRLHAGLTLGQVAQKLGVATPTVQKWEAGRVPVNIASLQALAVIFETEPAALLFPPLDQSRVEGLRTCFEVLSTADPAALDAWLNMGKQLIRHNGTAPDAAPPETPPKRRGRSATKDGT
jgi:transcriptional regulator with XRE-family HTH domain